MVMHEQVISLKGAGVVTEQPGVPMLPETMLLMDLPAAQKLMQREGKVGAFGITGLGDTAAGWLDTVRHELAPALPSTRFILPTAASIPVTVSRTSRTPGLTKSA
jgi:hypothetical protein